MTITGVYTQSLSISLTYSFSRQTVATAQPAAPGGAQASPATDSVTLSPEATSPAPEPDGGTGAATPAHEVSPSPTAAEGSATAASSRTLRRADALLAVLDGDKDGAISEEEFTDGAMALLRRAGARRHNRHVHGDEHGEHKTWSDRKAARLERKLERLFDRIDADGDGGVSRDEMTSALAQVTRDGHASCGPKGECQPAPTAGVTTGTSVTVSVAIQQYTAVAAIVPKPETAGTPNQP